MCRIHLGVERCCWSMSARVAPVGVRASTNFRIMVGPQSYSFDRPPASRRSTLSKSHHHLNLATGPSLSLGRSRNWCHSASTLFGVTSPLPSSIHCNSWICIFSLYKLSHHGWSVVPPSQPQSYSFDRPSASRRPKIKSTNLFVVGSPSQRSHSNELLTC